MTEEQREQALELIDIIRNEDLPPPAEFHELLLKRFRTPSLACVRLEVVWGYLEDVLDIHDKLRAEGKL